MALNPVIEVPERGERELRDEQQIRALVAAGPSFEERRFFSLRVRGGRYYLAAGKYIGVIPVTPDAIVHVVPKVPTGRLIRILRLAREDPIMLGLLERLYDPGKDQDVLDLLLLALRGELSILFTHGPIRQYVRHAGIGQSIRGRPLIGQTVTKLWSAGRFDQLAYEHFELDPQNPLNQAIEYTLWHVSRLCAEQWEPSRRKLLPDFLEAWRILGPVEPDRTRAFLPDLDRHLRANVTYEPFASFRPLLAICYMILNDLGVDLGVSSQGTLTLPPMVVDMETAFQSFLFHTLADRSARIEGLQCWNTAAERQRPLLRAPVEPIPQGFELDVSDEPAQPDFTIALEGIPILIGDAKYKSSHGAADVYQAFSHAAAYGAEEILLVYPSPLSGAKDVSFKCLGTVGEVRAFVATFPLEVETLEVAVDQLFEGILAISSKSLPNVSRS